ncbi:hypothetical protein GQX74_009242 [Glossina fuscipes]|nr:hypothetical protein GQX74_009242 [Glossina fuscipes]
MRRYLETKNMTEDMDRALPFTSRQAEPGEEGGGVQSYLSENKVPVSFLIMLLVQFLLIIIDRVVYLRKALRVKIVFHYISVVGPQHTKLNAAILTVYLLPADAVPFRIAHNIRLVVYRNNNDSFRVVKNGGYVCSGLFV